MRARDEAGRLEALRGLNLLDTPAGAAFDQITRLAARLFGTPIAAVSLIDDRRQWFKSRVGLDIAETPRAHAFCRHTMRSRNVMVVTDAIRDPRFRRNPLVLGAPCIRFYAGAPLITRDGYAIGSLCVIDDKPRDLSDDDRRTLAELASLIMIQIELGQAVGRVDPVTGLPNQYRYQDDRQPARPRYRGLSRSLHALCLRPARSRRAGLADDHIEADRTAAQAAAVQRLSRHLPGLRRRRAVPDGGAGGRSRQANSSRWSSRPRLPGTSPTA